MKNNVAYGVLAVIVGAAAFWYFVLQGSNMIPGTSVNLGSTSYLATGSVAGIGSVSLGIHVNNPTQSQFYGTLGYYFNNQLVETKVLTLDTQSESFLQSGKDNITPGTYTVKYVLSDQNGTVLQTKSETITISNTWSVSTNPLGSIFH